MTDNYDSGFDLVLSDHERDALLVYYTDNCLPEYHSDKEDDLWYGLQIGDRMFDLNVWTDDLTEELSQEYCQFLSHEEMRHHENQDKYYKILIKCYPTKEK